VSLNRWIRRAADGGGFAPAQHSMAIAHQMGTGGLAKDEKEVEQYLLRAAQSSFVPAEYAFISISSS
jgi:TPR repeat protein